MVYLRGELATSSAALLAVQAYVAAFHSGAVFYHRALGHHPLAGCAPGVFVVMAFLAIWLRTSLAAAVGIVAGAVLAARGLALVLVKPPPFASADNGSVSTSTSRTRLMN